MKLLVSVAGECKRRETFLLYRNAELLVEFADERRLRPLAGIELSAGELPEPGQRLARRALGDQHAMIRIDERAGDDQDEADGGWFAHER
jgi:hypothetical protein